MPAQTVIPGFGFFKFKNSLFIVYPMKNVLTAIAVCCAAVVFAQTPAKPAPKPAPAAATTKAPAATTTTTAKPASAPTTTTSKPAATTADPGYKFNTLEHDYGTIAKGSEPYCEFQLTNTSKEPLVIQEAHGSCGCTVPEYPKEPIKPGQTVTIKVRYDTNRVGPFEKQVTVTFQGKDTPAVLKIHGKVEAPASETPFPAPGNGTGNGGAPVNN